ALITGSQDDEEFLGWRRVSVQAPGENEAAHGFWRLGSLLFMLMIRMARFGAKKKPTYRVVVIDKERARDSKAIEVVGIYNPVAKPKAVNLNHERIAH